MALGMGNEKKLRYWLFKSLCNERLKKSHPGADFTFNCGKNVMKNALIDWFDETYRDSNQEYALNKNMHEEESSVSLEL